jgi:hypothetical protein
VRHAAEVSSAVPLPQAVVRGPRALARPLAGGLAATGVAAVLGAVGWLVLAAAERPSSLSPPTMRGDAGWLLGPLHGLLPGLTSTPSRLHSDMVAALVVAGVGWFAAWLAAPALRLRVLLGAVAVAHLVLFLAPPLPLTDVFNYELYGRMAAVHGLNPYRALPVQAVGDPVYALANWHHLRSPYGPLFTLLSEALVPFGAHAWLWAWKALATAGSLATVGLVASLAGQLGVSRERAVAAFGLSPLLLVAELGGAHNDVPALLCDVAAAWCVVRGRDAGAPAWVDVAAGGLVVAAAGIKPSFAIVVPLVVLGVAHRPRAIAGAVAATAVTGLVVLIAFGGALPDVSTQGLLVTPLSVPNLLGLAAGHGGADAGVRSVARVALAGVAALGALVVGWRRQLALSALGVVLFCAVLGLSWVMPWYLVWALPFVALARPRVLAPLAVVATAWLIAGSLPSLPGILHSAGYYPTRLVTGKANHLQFERLVK